MKLVLLLSQAALSARMVSEDCSSSLYFRRWVGQKSLQRKQARSYSSYAVIRIPQLYHREAIDRMCCAGEAVVHDRSNNSQAQKLGRDTRVVYMP